MTVSFKAHEYKADTSFELAEYGFHGSEADGWRLTRNGTTHRELGPGYRLLRTERCGVCSTDLDRHFLPFPLPQITGHELVATDPEGRRVVVEINASHAARGMDVRGCAFCSSGLVTHCPERLVLGIHDLPGGFGPWILAPRDAILEVPESIPSEAAVLVEPFAATLRAVHVSAARAGDRIAVLGPRRLGMLLVAALAAERQRSGLDFEIHALVRRDELGELARSFGADAHELVTSSDEQGTEREPDFDIVFDTTGNPDALAIAARRARREVHIKSTHGRPSAGLTQLTAMVVDELSIARLPVDGDSLAHAFELENLSRRSERACIVALGDSQTALPSGMEERFDVHRVARAVDARPLLRENAGLPRADAVVVAPRGALVDDAVRPSPEDEDSILRPRGTIFVDPRGDASDAGPVLEAVVTRDLRFATSRCGDFRAALELLASDAELRTRVQRLVTHRFAATDITTAFATARSKECVKAILLHEKGASA